MGLTAPNQALKTVTPAIATGSNCHPGSTVPVWLPEKQGGRYRRSDELCVHSPRILGAPKLVGFIGTEDEGVIEHHELWASRAWVAVGIIEERRVSKSSKSRLVGVNLGNHVPLWRLLRLEVPVPIGEGELVVPKQLREDPFVEVEEQAVPWQEQPVVVNLERVLVAQVEEMVVAVRAMHFGLVEKRAAVGVGEGAHELVGPLVLGNVLVIQQLRGLPDPHSQSGGKLEQFGLFALHDRRAAAFRSVVTASQLRSRERCTLHHCGDL
jgi:hypothetical protein